MYTCWYNEIFTWYSKKNLLLFKEKKNTNQADRKKNLNLYQKSNITDNLKVWVELGCISLLPCLLI